MHPAISVTGDYVMGILSLKEGRNAGFTPVGTAYYNANAMHSTEGKGLKSLESVIVRAVAESATTVRVTWSYPISGTLALGMKLTEADGGSVAASAANGAANPVIIYTFAGASILPGNGVLISYDAGVGDLTNTKSSNPVLSAEPAKPVRNDL